MNKEYVKTVKINSDYISEIKLTDDLGNNYFVVTELGDLLYATFDNSYIDYKKGITSVSPNKIEGENYLWFDIHENRNQTIFWEYYLETLSEATSKMNNEYRRHKYSHLKKPLNNINYKIIRKRDKDVFACGPVGTVYEIEFLIDNKETLFLYADDVIGRNYMIAKCSIFDFDESKYDINDYIVEMISDFSKAKKSMYYDLYLEMEKFIDGIN